MGAKVRIRIRIEELSLISARKIQYNRTGYVTHKYFLKNLVHISKYIFQIR
jgi:hypothetical protein